METLDDLDPSHAAAISREAIRLMTELNVPVIPTNFTVWFAYALGRFPALRQMINALRSENAVFDKTRNRELYSAFLQSSSLVHAGQSISQELGILLNNVRGDLSGAIAETTAQSAALQEVEQSLSDSRPTLAAARLASELKLATQRASALESKLAAASIELDSLKVDLEQAEAESRTDALTGLANRRALEDFLARAHSERRGDHFLSVLMVDIDHFKQFNDKHGHQIGDQVLKVVAKCVQDGIRIAVDIAARYGGEEFVCVVPGHDVSEAARTAEGIRSKISQSKIIRRASGEELAKITVSIGVTQLLPGESFETLFERCDRALYQAKQRGRNRVVAL